METQKPNEIIESDLSKIQPFSGTSEELTAAERMLEEGKALQKVQTPYVTAIAVQKPRSIARYVNNVLEECRMAGAAFYYGWVANTKNGPVKIEGPSIDLAMCLARNYGNCAIDIHEEENPLYYMMKGFFIDLESGFTCPRLFRQRKSQSLGGKWEKDADRQEDIVFQIGQSKAIRNAIVRAMPRWLIDRAIETAKEAEIQNIKEESPAIARSKVLSFFKEYGISAEQIEAKIGKKADNWTAHDIADLRASATAIKEGRVTANELFSVDEEKPVPETGKKDESPDKDPIRKQYIGLRKGDGVKTGLKPWVMSHLDYIPKLAQKYQDEIKDKFKQIYGSQEPYPLDDKQPPKQEDPLLDQHTEPEETEDEPVIPCSRRGDTLIKPSFCKNACPDRDKCADYRNWQDNLSKDSE